MIIVKLLGFKHYMPPFAKSKGKNILSGVNYASGSAGIRDESGQQLVNLIINHHRIATMFFPIFYFEFEKEKGINVFLLFSFP